MAFARSNHMSIDGKVVAVTGGARGIGLAIARELGSRGAQVAIGDLDLDLAQEVAAAETSILPLQLNVADSSSFREFLEAVETELGPIHALINNAGIMPVGPFLDESEAMAERILDVNLLGVILGCKLALPAMQRQGTGHIVNVASQAGKGGFAGGATYCASKHGVVGLSEALSEELEKTDIEVSVVMPAMVRTELAGGVVSKPVGIRWSEPEDVARAVAGTLESPRFDVYVPREGEIIWRLAPLLPKVLKRWLFRVTGVSRLLGDLDATERAAYEARVSPTEGGQPPS